MSVEPRPIEPRTPENRRGYVHGYIDALTDVQREGGVTPALIEHAQLMAEYDLGYTPPA